MPRFLTLSLAFVALALLAGCQVEQEYWLNPDGSGKVIQRTTMNADGNDHQGGNALKDLIFKSTGVEGWADLSTATQDGKVTAQATAYFPDIAKLNLQGGPYPTPHWITIAGGGGTIHVDLGEFQYGSLKTDGASKKPPHADS